MKVIANPFTILLGRDDMPTCPVHGTRIVTDFVEPTPADPDPHEMGQCKLCRKTYRFQTNEEIRL